MQKKCLIKIELYESTHTTRNIILPNRALRNDLEKKKCILH
jgi:hypothetical protein